MLPKSHQENLSTWLESVTTFETLLLEHPDNFLLLKEKWQEINTFLNNKILVLTDDNLEQDQKYLFRSWQTETNRYLRLLQTDFLFYQSAQKNETKRHRFTVLKVRLNEIINLTKNYLQNVISIP